MGPQLILLPLHLLPLSLVLLATLLFLPRGLPALLRIIVPPLTSEFLNNLKNTSVALTIGLLELTSRTRAMQEFSFQVFEAFTAATILYLLINLGVVMASRWLESRLAVPGLIALKK